MSDGFASPFDEVLWDWTNEGRPVGVDDARIAAINRHGGHEVQVSFETVYTSGDHPFDLFRLPRDISGERVSSGALEVLRLEDAEGRWVLAAQPSASAGVYHLVSGLPTTHPRSKRVERWLVHAREISRCFLSHDDFASIGDRLSEWGDVEVVKLAGRMVRDGSSVNRGFPALAEGLRPNHRDGLREAENLGAAVRTMTLHVSNTLHVHLRRVAGATLYSGHYRVFEELVLGRLEAATDARRALLSGRARKALVNPSPPLTVTLPAPILASRDETGALLDVMHGMSHYSLAVFHRNPYLHIALTDEGDGSNFDVMITRPDAIDIYPGYRASAAALGRVTQQLSERFGALDVRERADEDLPSIYELVEG